MFEKIDSRLQRFWRKPLRMLCHVSGKSNFFWSYALTCISMIIVMYGYVSYFPSRFDFVCLIQQCMSAVHAVMMTEIVRTQQALLKHPDRIPQTFLVVPRTAFPMRLTYGILGCASWIFGLIVGDRLSLAEGLVFGFLHIATYWASEMQPPSKSLLRKLVDRVRVFLAHLTTPTPSLTPAG